MPSTILGLHHVTAIAGDPQRNLDFYAGVLGLRLVKLTVNFDDPGTYHRIVEVRSVGGFGRGADGVGAVHHVAFAVADDDAQLAMRERVIAAGLDPTPVIDRQYFHSVYFREPGGVLFELATVPPGFTVDEPLDQLGTSLKLPPQYESDRALLRLTLPEIHRVERV